MFRQVGSAGGEQGVECAIPISVLKSGDFFGEMTLLEMQNRSATVVAESLLNELTARKLCACDKADIHAYVIVLQNINRELCGRLRHAERPLHGPPARGRRSIARAETPKRLPGRTREPLSGSDHVAGMSASTTGGIIGPAGTNSLGAA